jgi:predicted RNA-binding Zn-ribbon protein involved in translation (DUF1610 family)
MARGYAAPHVAFVPDDAGCGVRLEERNDCVAFTVPHCGRMNGNKRRHRPPCPVAVGMAVPVRIVLYDIPRSSGTREQKHQ